MEQEKENFKCVFVKLMGKEYNPETYEEDQEQFLKLLLGD